MLMMPSHPQSPSKRAPSASGEITSGEALNNLMMKSLRKQNSESESGSSNGGNNSDNSALVSLGNNSFGFNFDSEETNSKEGQNDSNEDSDGCNAQSDKKALAVCSSSAPAKKRSNSALQHKHPTTAKGGNGGSDEFKSTTSSLSSSMHSNKQYNNGEQNEAAAKAVASLESIARSYPIKNAHHETGNAAVKREAAERKRKASDDKDADSGGYNTDDDEGRTSRASGNESSNQGEPKSRKMKREENGNKREERNQREKERSFRISKQITELRNLLSSGGVVVPKGTKSSVLTEAANYIRILQQHQYRSEIDRHQLVQQMQLIGGGAHGEQAAVAVRHFAAQNGVWTLGNFGGVPPKSAMTFVEPPTTISQPLAQPPQESNALQQNKVEPSDYRFIFNSCGAGMAIASMGGTFIDCNQLFSQLSDYSKQEICSLTLFNLTARQDLQQAFDQISRLISPPMNVEKNEERVKPIVLRGAMKNRDDLGMSISLVKGEDGIAKCFCVTLVKNPASPFDTGKPVPVSFDAIKSSSAVAAGQPTTKDGDGINTTPAFTSG